MRAPTSFTLVAIGALLTACVPARSSAGHASAGGPVRTASHQVAALGGPVPSCSPTTLSYNVDAANPLTVSATVLVHRASIAELQRALDPQHWDVCSKFWRPPPRTYLATRSGSTVTQDPAKPSDLPYHHSFYEHFHTTSCQKLPFPSCHTADFENMLDITSTPGTSSYRADYLFDAPTIRGTVDNVPVSITIDNGHISAAPGPSAGTWIVEGKKTLLFNGKVANIWAQIAFGFGLQGLATEIAELACCDVPPPE
jgi:hypothetical protein